MEEGIDYIIDFGHRVWQRDDPQIEVCCAIHHEEKEEPASSQIKR